MSVFTCTATNVDPNKSLRRVLFLDRPKMTRGEIEHRVSAPQECTSGSIIDICLTFIELMTQVSQKGANGGIGVGQTLSKRVF